MKRMKLIGLSLLAIFALGALAVTTASAEEGFLPSPGLANVLGGLSTLEIEGGGKITCEKLDETHIEFLSLEPDRHAEGTLHWLGCKAENLFKANSLGDKEGEILVPVLLLVCLDTKNAEKKLVTEFGVLALVVGTTHLEVPAVGTLIEVKGQALASIKAKAGEKLTLFVAEFVGSKGKQNITKCLIGAKEVTHNLEGSTNHAAFKPASENVAGGLVQFESAVELMDS